MKNTKINILKKITTTSTIIAMTIPNIVNWETIINLEEPETNIVGTIAPQNWNIENIENQNINSWTEIQASETITNTFTRNWENWKVEFSESLDGFSNRFTNLNNNKTYVYKYNYDGQKGSIKDQWTFNEDNFIKSKKFYKKEENGSIKKKIVTNLEKNGKTAIREEILYTTPNGSIVHEVGYTNTSNTTIENFQIIQRLDTKLNDNDKINIKSDGQNGGYMESWEFKLYIQQIHWVEKTTFWTYSSNYTDQKTSNHIPAGDLITNNVDSGFHHVSPIINLEPGQTYKMYYKETVYPGQENYDFVNFDNNRNSIVIYDFVSGSAGIALPENIKNLKPENINTHHNETITPTQPEQTTITVENWVWNFAGYNKNTFIVNEDEEFITGVWNFVPNENPKTADNFVLNNPEKTIVNNLFNLNQNEKNSVIQKIKNANQNIGENTNIEVANNGRVKIIFEDNSIKFIEPEIVIEKLPIRPILNNQPPKIEPVIQTTESDSDNDGINDTTITTTTYTNSNFCKEIKTVTIKTEFEDFEIIKRKNPNITIENKTQEWIRWEKIITETRYTTENLPENCIINPESNLENTKTENIIHQKRDEIIEIPEIKNNPPPTNTNPSNSAGAGGYTPMTNNNLNNWFNTILNNNINNSQNPENETILNSAPTIIPNEKPQNSPIIIFDLGNEKNEEKTEEKIEEKNIFTILDLGNSEENSNLENPKNTEIKTEKTNNNEKKFIQNSKVELPKTLPATGFVSTILIILSVIFAKIFLRKRKSV